MGTNGKAEAGSGACPAPSWRTSSEPVNCGLAHVGTVTSLRQCLTESSLGRQMYLAHKCALVSLFPVSVPLFWVFCGNTLSTALEASSPCLCLEKSQACSKIWFKCVMWHLIGKWITPSQGHCYLALAPWLIRELLMGSSSRAGPVSPQLSAQGQICTYRFGSVY